MDARRTFLHCAMIMFCFQACTSLNVKTDFDSSADFTKFRTFAFTGLTDINEGGILNNSLTRKRLESLVARELTSKGLRQVGLEGNPDLFVHYWLGVQEKQQIESTGPVGPYGGYGWGAGYGGVSTYDYKEGTLIVDLVKPAKNELVWRATMIDTLDDTSKENMELADQALAKAFEQYPPSQKTH